MVTVEAIRIAQEKYGKGKPVTGEQVLGAGTHEPRTPGRLGAEGFMPPTVITCRPRRLGHDRSRRDGGGKPIRLIAPEKEIAEGRGLVEAYAKEKGMTEGLLEGELKPCRGWQS
jgi:branched-chain amino acid transport system substrate-binding protein